jgi:hypothetical protein
VVVEGDFFYTKFALAGFNLNSSFGAHSDEDEEQDE